MLNSVHWHGIELTSFNDGVPGWSGTAGRIAPLIAPSDSFAARFTPPRAGTFIYHAHVADREQISSGLYGPMIVLEPGKAWDAKLDHVTVFGVGRPYMTSPFLLNGSAMPPPLRLRANTTHRLRFINIAPEDAVTVEIARDSSLLVWRPRAKDGADIPPGNQVPRPAKVQLFPGETYDFDISFERGEAWLHFGDKSRRRIIAF